LRETRNQRAPQVQLFNDFSPSINCGTVLKRSPAANGNVAVLRFVSERSQNRFSINIQETVVNPDKYSTLSRIVRKGDFHELSHSREAKLVLVEPKIEIGGCSHLKRHHL
jgi:hypothetical protein